MNTQNEQDLKGIFALFKGASGTGKSVAALSFPGLFNFDYDFKMPAIALKHFPKKSIEWETFNDTDNVSNLLASWLECPACGYKRTCQLCGTKCPYETLLHDSITGMENLVVKTIAETKGESVPQMMKSMLKSKGNSSSNKTDMMDFDYYKAEMRFTDWLISVNKVLWARQGNPKHVIFTAHVLTTENRNILTGLVTRTKSIVSQGNKVAAYVPTQFDEDYTFAYGEEGGLDGRTTEIKRYVTTRPQGEDMARSAYRLPDIIEFTNGSFYDIMQGHINGQKFSAGL